MSAEVLSGKILASEIRQNVADSAEELKANGITPTLAVIVATDDESTEYYVRHILSAGEKTGIKVEIVRLASDSNYDSLASELNRLGSDKSVHGIILQTPLPSGLDANKLRALIPPEKDVDGANPLSAGRLVSGVEAFAPTTAVAVMEILKRYDLPVASTHAVIIGRSMVVGKPLAQLLLAKNATVTICHSKTRNLSDITNQADILVVAIGKPHMITGNYVKQGAVVIDVALLLDFAHHRAATGMAGDQAREGEIASALLRPARVAPIHHGLHPFP